jgi:hypothetical protein
MLPVYFTYRSTGRAIVSGIVPPVEQRRKAMKLMYTYTMEDGYYAGHLDGYPKYVIQGENRGDFENALREIYGWIPDGTLTAS